jgi:hypothetical protein
MLIQIDGLSHSQLSLALIKHEHYRLHRQYAGAPSTTVAVQAELFYSIKTAVPGFNFIEHVSGKLVHMFEPEIAARMGSKLER